MKWDDFVNQKREAPSNMEPTDIECPNCDCKIYRRTDMVLTTYPPKYSYVCTSCGWTGTAHK